MAGASRASRSGCVIPRCPDAPRCIETAHAIPSGSAVPPEAEPGQSSEWKAVERTGESVRSGSVRPSPVRFRRASDGAVPLANPQSGSAVSHWYTKSWSPSLRVISMISWSCVSVAMAAIVFEVPPEEQVSRWRSEPHVRGRDDVGVAGRDAACGTAPRWFRDCPLEDTTAQSLRH